MDLDWIRCEGSPPYFRRPTYLITIPEPEALKIKEIATKVATNAKRLGRRQRQETPFATAENHYLGMLGDAAVHHLFHLDYDPTEALKGPDDGGDCVHHGLKSQIKTRRSPGGDLLVTPQELSKFIRQAVYDFYLLWVTAPRTLRIVGQIPIQDYQRSAPTRQLHKNYRPTHILEWHLTDYASPEPLGIMTP